MRELDHLAGAIQMSERARPRDLVAAQLRRRRARGLPTLVAASASIGAAFLAAMAVALPGRTGLAAEQPVAESAPNSSFADPPPRHLVLLSLKEDQQAASRPASERYRPQGPQP